MNDNNLDKALPESPPPELTKQHTKNWQAPELVELDVAENTRTGIPGPGDGPFLYS